MQRLIISGGAMLKTLLTPVYNTHVKRLHSQRYQQN